MLSKVEGILGTRKLSSETWETTFERVNSKSGFDQKMLTKVLALVLDKLKV